MRLKFLSPAAPVSVSYWTYSSVPVLLTHTPADGAIDVNRGTSIALKFSEPMNMDTFNTGILISDDTRAPITFTAVAAGSYDYVLTPDVVLAPNALITVDLTTDLQTIYTTHLGANQTFSFTTGETVDVTPPTIVSFDPADGSTIPTNQATLTVNFSEPMDTNLSPSMINGQLAWLLSQSAQQPEWNSDNTSFTVYLPAELPAGLHLEAAFADYADAAGIVQPAETTLSLTVAGTADPIPVADGQRFIMSGLWTEGVLGNTTPADFGHQVTYFQYTARGTAGQYNREEHSTPNYDSLEYYDILAFDSSGIQLLGFAESPDFAEIVASSGLTMLELPYAQGNNWTGSATITIPDGTFDVELSGNVVGQADLNVGQLDGTTFVWTDVWEVDTVMTLTQGSTVIAEEHQIFWYAPGVGLVRNFYHNDDHDQGSWSHFDIWLQLN
jgi:hypothetical protein